MSDSELSVGSPSPLPFTEKRIGKRSDNSGNLIEVDRYVSRHFSRADVACPLGEHKETTDDRPSCNKSRFEHDSECDCCHKSRNERAIRVLVTENTENRDLVTKKSITNSEMPTSSLAATSSRGPSTITSSLVPAEKKETGPGTTKGPPGTKKSLSCPYTQKMGFQPGPVAFGQQLSTESMFLRESAHCLTISLPNPQSILSLGPSLLPILEHDIRESINRMAQIKSQLEEVQDYLQTFMEKPVYRSSNASVKLQNPHSDKEKPRVNCTHVNHLNDMPQTHGFSLARSSAIALPNVHPYLTIFPHIMENPHANFLSL